MAFDSGESTLALSQPSTASDQATQIPNAVSSGLHSGIALAQMQENLQMGQAKLAIDKQTHQQQALDKFLDIAVKAGRTKGPVQGVLLQSLKQVAPMAGINSVNDDFLAGLKTPDSEVNQYMSHLYSSPREYLASPQGWQELLSMTGGDAAAAQDIAKKALDPTNALERAKIMALGQAQTAAARQAVARENIQAGNIKAGVNPAAYNPQTGQFNPDAAAAAAQSNLNLKENVSRMAKQNADTRLSQLDINQQKANQAYELGKQKNDILSQKLSTQGASLDLRTKNQLLTANNKITRDPIIVDTERAYNSATRAGQLLDTPNVKWADMSEVVASLNQVLSGSSRAAQSREQKIDFQSLSRIKDTIEGKVTNHEEGGPSPEELQLFKSRIQRVGDFTAQAHDAKAERLVGAMKGIIPDQYRNQFLDNVKLQKHPLTSGVGTSAAPVAAGTPQASAQPSTTPKTPSPAFLQQLQQTFGGDQNKTNAFLQSKGYQVPNR